ESWAVELALPPGLFPLLKGQFFAYSGNTGGSAGPHVHFEIRDTKSDNCLNPLLFGFPLPDAFPPAISRLAVYDRTRSVYAQSPTFIGMRKIGSKYGLTGPGVYRTGKSKVSFAVGATDRLSGSPNPNGIYSTSTLIDGRLASAFILDDINYAQTRYLNAQIDYRYKYGGGAWLQHLSPMPGDVSSVYSSDEQDGVLDLTDGEVHSVLIEVRDAAGNLSQLQFSIQYDPALAKPGSLLAAENFIPNHVNVFEEEAFEAFTSEHTVYDTVPVSFKSSPVTTAFASPVYTFIGASIPAHDSITVRIKSDVQQELKDKAVIQSFAGSRRVVQKGIWSGEWVRASFRQFGTFQLLIDTQPPAINAPPLTITGSNRIVFTPTDNFSTIKRFRAEVDGKWLRFTNNGGRSWIYTVDDRFPPGVHELKVTVEDEAGNITTKSWNIRR
ncbi:MAG TPA: Ig-like domain-containing protein, partial [Flavisolibacter sp.]